MMLFDVPDDTRVRVTSKLIRWVEHGKELIVAENVTWEGTTTDCFEEFRGEKRRLIIDHTIIPWAGHGTWQLDTECEVMEDSK